MDKKLDNVDLFLAIKQLIDKGKEKIAISVNASMSMLYWQIGLKINEETLQLKRAEYGKQIVATLSRQLHRIHINKLNLFLYKTAVC